MDAFIQQNSWIFSKESPFSSDDPNHHFISSPNSSISWLRTLEKNKTFPVLHVSVNEKNHYWIAHNAVADIRGSRRRLEHLVYKAFSRLLPHDINGKMMGINGMIDYWKEAPLDASTLSEDLQSVRESLSSVSQLANALGWFSKEGDSEHRVFTLKEIHALLSPILPRLCKPSAAFTVPLPASPSDSFLSAPHTVVFWSVATAILLSRAKGADEKISFSWAVEKNLDTAALRLEVECTSLLSWMEGQTPPSDDSTQLFHDWLVVLAAVKGSVSSSGVKVQISIPMRDLVVPGYGKIICIGHQSHAQHSPFSEKNTLFLGDTLQEFVEAFSHHLFSPAIIFLAPSVPQETAEIIRGIVSSVSESPLLIR